MDIRISFIIGLIITINSYSYSQTSLSIAENFSVKTPSGENYNLFEILDNGQYVVIDFFNITCGPCQIFAPHIQSSSMHYGNNQEDVLFLGISYSGDNSLIVEWDSTYGITYPTISGQQGGGVDVHLAYEVLSVPTIVLIAPDKNIIGQLFLPDYTPATHVIDSMLMAHGLFPAITDLEENKPGQNQSFLIFPNPIKDRATLELDVTQNSQVEIELINMLGRSVYQSSSIVNYTGKHSIELKFENIEKGVYLLNIRDNNDLFYNQKVVFE